MDQTSYEKAIYRTRTLSLLVAVSTLLLALVYVLGYVYLVPYPGFDYTPKWRVVAFLDGCGKPLPGQNYSGCESPSGGILYIGDEIQQIRTPDGTILRREEYDWNLLATPFRPSRPGDVVELKVLRNDDIHTVRWTMSGPSTWSSIRRLASLLLFLPFWLAGTIVLLTFRPRDERWLLLVAVNYVTGLWSTIGDVSFSQFLGSAVWVVVLSWLLMALYLHLHLVVPEVTPIPFRRYVLAGLYTLSIAGATLTLIHVLPLSSYYIALLIGMGGSLAMLILRATRPPSPAVRAAARLMLSGIGVAILPGIFLWLVPILIDPLYTPEYMVTVFVTLAIPLLPLFYLYALYKHRLGDLEVRANRALNNYSFFVLYSTFFMFVFVIASRWINIDSTIYGFVLIFSGVYVLLAFGLREPYNRLVNRLAYGTHYEPEKVVREFANEIPRALTPIRLADLLRNRVMPSLMIRQSALIWLRDSNAPKPSILYQEKVALSPTALTMAHVEHLMSRASQFLLEGPAGPYQWVHLVIPIKVDERLVGVWLFGGRDPDDFYPKQDIDLLSTLGNQVGVALEIARLFEIEHERAAELERTNLELRRAIRVKNDMLRNISHELRTPLTAITGYTDLLLDGVAGPLTDEQINLLEVVAKNASALKSLINDLIAYQQTRSQQLEASTFNIVDLARTCIHDAQLLTGKMGYWNAAPPTIELECEEPQMCISANPAQMSQVFNNLLSNAVKFSPDGGRVLVSIQRGAHHFDTFEGPDGPLPPDQPLRIELPALIVSVSDQGIGIPQEELDNIWLDFYQIDGSATRRFGGTGLGLALVKEIILSHGGEVWVESEVGAGTTFYFAIPLHEADNPSSSLE